MATWKKVIVSGSNVSQLNNDAGYLTAASTGKSFATASINGINLLADTSSGSLNFASSSGQGLTIVGDAGTDTLTFGLAAIPNASLLNSGSIIGNTVVNLGTTVTTIAGLVSVTSTGFSGSFSGSLEGTGSYATQALSASFASTAPYSGLSGVPSGIVSGSSQVAALLPAGTVSGSSLSSPSQGNAILTTNGVAGSTIGLGLTTSDSPTFTNLNLSGDLTVLGTTTTIQTNNLLVEDQFILVSSGSANNSTDGGIIVDRGIYAAGNTALGYDATSFRWGLQNGLADPTNTVDLGAASGGVSGSFLAHVFTEAVHGATKPTAGEFAVAGAIYTSTAEDIWIYS